MFPAIRMNTNESHSHKTSTPCVMVIFGASGHLARRKLIPALYALERRGLLEEHFSIVGFARTPNVTARFRKEMADAVSEASSSGRLDAALWQRFSSRLHYVTGEYDQVESCRRLHEFLAGADCGCARGRILYYMALPPRAVEPTLRTLYDSRCIPWHKGASAPRLMIEKPFGWDAASACRLNRLLARMLPESQIYRIDHYLAKDTVRNLLVLRFANAIFEPLWNCAHVDSVQLTAAEDVGVEGRGAYYDEAGVVRDYVQNHVLQVLALAAMERPESADAQALSDRKLEFFESIAPVRRGDFVFGQYRGYTREPHVAARSRTPTFLALRLRVNNRRWKGVPFYVRAGKRLPRKVTEITIQFKTAPTCVFDGRALCGHAPNALSIRIQPAEGMRLSFSTKAPGLDDELRRANLDFRYSQLGAELPEAYEKVLLDGIRGHPGLFWQADELSRATGFGLECTRFWTGCEI
jgi:glucose-6-phosphate 1-dehydrogenase